MFFTCKGLIAVLGQVKSAIYLQKLEMQPNPDRKIPPLVPASRDYDFAKTDPETWVGSAGEEHHSAKILKGKCIPVILAR